MELKLTKLEVMCNFEKCCQFFLIWWNENKEWQENMIRMKDAWASFSKADREIIKM